MSYADSIVAEDLLDRYQFTQKQIARIVEGVDKWMLEANALYVDSLTPEDKTDVLALRTELIAALTASLAV